MITRLDKSHLISCMGEEETRRLLELLKTEGVEYKLYEHEPVYTSEQAAKVRGVELKTGVKAMVLKKKFSTTSRQEKISPADQYILADIAADRRLDFRKLEKLLDPPVKKLEFATKEEVIAATGCEAGCVHPVGRLFSLDTYLDQSVFQNEFVNFNIGLLTKSVRIRKDDLVRIVKPRLLGSFAKL
jgi:Ala-tRNA(Pro) deacylase